MISVLIVDDHKVVRQGLSFLLETWQGLIGRSGDAVDVVHNTAGALLGVLLARFWTYLASQGTV